jgi:3-oxosteroid 1-dehydrogenase
VTTASAEGDTVACDVLVVGSGSAALTAALATAAGRLAVVILEKSDKLGGTSAMSGAGTWVPANHHARTAGLDDSPEEALAYLRSTAPPGWQATEDALWQSFVRNAPDMLRFVETHTPLRFALTREPDPLSEHPGAKARGRMLSPRPLSRWLIGRYAKHLRGSTLPQVYTYQEAVETDLYHHPIRVGLSLAPRLVWRWLTNSAGKGTALITGLLRGCLDHGCRIERETRAVALLTDEAGAVTGAVVEKRGRQRRYLARRGVVLATGGFEWNDALFARHFPGPLDFRASPRTNEGDGHRMAEAVGADLAHMDQANISPNIPTRYEGRLHGMPVPFHGEPNAILVNRHGQRFVDEMRFNIGEVLDARDPGTGLPVHLPAWLISDARMLRNSPIVRWFSRHDRKWLVEAPTLPALAERVGLPPAALEATVARFNEMCRIGQDLDFHRGHANQAHTAVDRRKHEGLAAIERAPFIAMPFNRSILATKGGPRTNEHGEVLRPDGSVITGLYCAGVAMANPIGTRAVSAGTTIGPNMTWGYICARRILSRNA